MSPDGGKGQERTVTYLLDKHFITIFLIAGFSMYLWRQRRTGEAEYRIYWMTIVSTIILIVADCVVIWAQGDPGRRMWRLLFTVLGYVTRPVAALSITLIVYPKEQKPRYLQIPFFFNLLIYCTAFFSTIAIGFNENYELVRGPFGYTVFSVSFFYILFSVLTTWDRFKREDHGRERYILYVCALACVIAAAIDGDTDGDHVNAAIMVSSIFLYMFLRFFGANRDPLTKMMNRMAFYEDCDRFSETISAVASVDMNGLKKLNDAKGHEAGDEALKAIGQSLKDVGTRSILPYRIGGDEFIMLFIRQEETTVKNILEQMRALISEAGYSVSVGYAMREGRNDTVTEILRRSDEKMYADKANYYLQNTHDRRRRKFMETQEGRK